MPWRSKKNKNKIILQYLFLVFFARLYKIKVTFFVSWVVLLFYRYIKTNISYKFSKKKDSYLHVKSII